MAGTVLLRGTLMPQMGSTTGYKEQQKTRVSFPVRKSKVLVSSSATSRNNRIPSSITLKRNNGGV